MFKNSLLSGLRTTSTTVAAMMAFTLFLVTGCASVGGPQESKTLSAFEQLQVQSDGSRAWRSPQASRYDAVRIDLSAVTFGPEVKLNAQQQDQLQAALSSALKEKFASAGIPVAQAGDGRRAATVRATFAAVEVTNPALNAVTTLLLFAPVSRGGVTLELEALDSQSGQRVAAMALVGKAGLENITSAYSTIGHARLQTELAAERFVTLLTGKTPAAAPANSASNNLVDSQ
jgi:hypothetical protein